MLGRGSVGVVVDVELASLRSDLALHSGKEADERVVIVLGPTIEGMIVALCALDADAGEHLGHVLGDGLRVVLPLRQHSKEIHCGILKVASGACKMHPKV